MLKDQEQQYLKGYSIYVSEKEKELRELVTKLNERFQNNSVKDEIIHSLKQTIKKNYETATRQQEEIKELKTAKKLTDEKYEALENDRDFLKQQLVESKRQNKLLKLAIGRLQTEIEETRIEFQKQ